MATKTGKIPYKKFKECLRWTDENIKDNNLRTLVNEYWQNSLVLYTGAGVSSGPSKPIKNKKFGLPSWMDMLKHLSKQKNTDEWPEDPWEAADLAVGEYDETKEFKKRLADIIQSKNNYSENYGQLNWKFIANAPTLNAVAAFCGKLIGRITNPNIKNPRIVSYRSSANPKVRAVLTSNYDCFLEAAASNLFRKSPLKPVTVLGSLGESLGRIPVFHIHGYVPHPYHQKKSVKQTISNLIITRSDYEKSWRSDDIFGSTMGPQIHYLRYFTVLFIGFSFADKYVYKLLRHINDNYLKYKNRSHFALLQDQYVKEQGESFFENIGIKPIIYKEHDDIPSILGQVYEAGLVTDRILSGKTPVTQIKLPAFLVKEHTPTNYECSYSTNDIWKLMMSCRNESVNSNIVKKFEKGAKIT